MLARNPVCCGSAPRANNCCRYGENNIFNPSIGMQALMKPAKVTVLFGAPEEHRPIRTPFGDVEQDVKSDPCPADSLSPGWSFRLAGCLDNPPSRYTDSTPLEVIVVIGQIKDAPDAPDDPQARHYLDKSAKRKDLRASQGVHHQASMNIRTSSVEASI